MIKNSRRFKLKITITIAFLAFAFYLVVSAMEFFKSSQSTEFLRLFSVTKSPAKAWRWCPEEPKLTFKSSKFKDLNERDLAFLCAVRLEEISTDEVKLVSGAVTILKVEGEGGVKEVRATIDYVVFEIDGLPFKNANWTQFFQSQNAASSP